MRLLNFHCQKFPTILLLCLSSYTVLLQCAMAPDQKASSFALYYSFRKKITYRLVLYRTKKTFETTLDLFGILRGYCRCSQKMFEQHLQNGCQKAFGHSQSIHLQVLTLVFTSTSWVPCTTFSFFFCAGQIKVYILATRHSIFKQCLRSQYAEVFLEIKMIPIVGTLLCHMSHYFSYS